MTTYQDRIKYKRTTTRGKHMGEIIYVDFKKRSTPEPQVLPYSVMSYLKQCRDVLVEEDYHELMSAIVDPGIYAKCDEDIRKLADGYFAQLINTKQ